MNTIFTAERELYLTLHQLSKHHPIVNEWLACLPQWLSNIKDKSRYAHAPAYLAAVDRLPPITAAHQRQVDLTKDAIQVTLNWSMAEYKQSKALLKQLMPWRKGPFCLGSDEQDKQIYVDTEWRSDWKWQRIAPHLSDLRNRRVLDVGGGSGYHGWRMAGGQPKPQSNSQQSQQPPSQLKPHSQSEPQAGSTQQQTAKKTGADLVIIIDPSCLFYHQFMAIRHFICGDDNDGSVDADASYHKQSHNNHYPVHYIPVGLEELPEHSQLFDTVFSMGVLYHRQSPFEHLQRLKGQLVKGGELVLETLVIEGDSNQVLVPKDRYAQMNNVYFLPSVAALTLWLTKAGFVEVRCVDVNVTSIKEQRATDWMVYHSLADFLDKKDPSKTIEGYPAPMRAVMIAKKP